MATLAHRWELDENTGTTAEDIVGVRDGTITVVSSSPAWVDDTEGGICLDFAGNTGSSLGIVTAAGGTACDMRLPFTMVCWFKRDNETTVNDRYLFGLSSAYPNDVAQHFLYIGNDEKLRFHMDFVSGLAPHRISTPSASVIPDDASWHMAVGRWNGWASGTTSESYPGSFDVFLDAVKGTTYSVGSPYGLYNRGSTDVTIGSNTKLGTYWYGGSNAMDSNSDGEFNGRINRVRIYCGALTDQEIEDLYNGNPPINVIMFSCNT